MIRDSHTENTALRTIVRRLASLLLCLFVWTLPAGAAPLPVDEAFTLQVSEAPDGGLAFQWQIAPGYYLYREHIEAKTADGGTPLPLETGTGIAKDDPNFGTTEIYYASAAATLAAPGDAPIALTYQGCQEDGICYRPETRIIDPLTLAVTAQGGLVAPKLSAWTPAPADTATAPSTDRASETTAAAPAFELAEDPGLIPSLMARGGVILVLAAFPLFGLLLAFTPCVFPMYPIMAGALAREGERLTPRRGFVLSSLYVLGLASAFALLGAAAGWSGQNLQMVLQSPWMAGVLALLFAVLALSMFGLYELQLPARWTNALSRGTGQGAGSKRAAVVLGFSSALIVGPCVTAPLAGALLYIAQTADVTLGAAALFGLGIGKGIPLIVFSTLGGGVLPRAGAWMDTVKQVFGFGFLATAIWMAAPLLPAGLELFLWAALLIGFGTYAFVHWPVERSGVVVVRTASLLALLYGAVLTVGAAAGSNDPLKPLAVFAGGGSAGTSAPPLVFAPTGSTKAFQAQLAEARGARPTMIYFTADWCVTCYTIERSVLPAPDVKQALSGFQLVKADVSDIDPANTELMAQLKVAGPPTMIFFDEGGKEIAGARLVGDIDRHTLAASADLAKER